MAQTELKPLLENEKQFKEYVTKVINDYIPVLLLQRYTFEIRKGKLNKKCLFECSLCYPYLNACIFYSESTFKDWEKGIDLTSHIVHEMCHIVTDPLYSKATHRYVTKNEIEEERELLTDHICNIILKTYKENLG